VSTGTSRSFTLLLKYASPAPTDQSSVTIVSPGKTGLLKRPSIVRSLFGSPPHSAPTAARPATPKVHSPCRIGCSKWAFAATAGSEWMGFRSSEASR